jgi:hypothetical protein
MSFFYILASLSASTKTVSSARDLSNIKDSAELFTTKGIGSPISSFPYFLEP